MSQLPFDRLQVFRVGTTGEYHRILWVDDSPEGPHRYAIIRLDGPLRLPRWITSADLAANIAQSGWTATDENPFRFSFRSEADLPENPNIRQRYLESWKSKLRCVRMVTELGRDAFIGRCREARIQEIRLMGKAKPGGEFGDPNGDNGACMSAGAIRKWLILFWRSGEDPASLFPRHNQRGRKPYSVSFADKGARPKVKPGRKRKAPGENGALGCDLDPVKWKNLIKGAQEFLFKPNGRHFTHGRRLPWRYAHKATLAKHFSTSVRIDHDNDGNALRVQAAFGPAQWPTLAQFRTAALSGHDLPKRIKQVVGERAYKTSFRPIPGSSFDIARAPGSVFQVDWMVAKIWLASQIDGGPCGRPHVFFVIDVYSRMIVGVYVTFEDPMYRTGAMALVEAMSDKVAFAARYGVTLKPEDWPCQHAPNQILNDGGELAAKLGDYVPGGVCDLVTVPAYRPDLKGIVERCFGVGSAGLIEWQRGAASASRPDDAPDPRRTSSLTIGKFTHDLVRWVVFEHNRHPITKITLPIEAQREGVDPVPIELWNWGIRRLSGRPRHLPRTDLIPRMMPRIEAQVTRRGIELEGARYFSDSGFLQTLVHQAALTGRAITLEVAHDPNNTNEIYLINPKAENQFETIPIVPGSPYAGMTFKEARRQMKELEDRVKYLQGVRGTIGVEEERMRQERGAEADRERDEKQAAAANGSFHPAATDQAERKAEEIKMQQDEERMANATAPCPGSVSSAQDQPSAGATKPIANRVLRLRSPDSQEEDL